MVFLTACKHTQVPVPIPDRHVLARVRGAGAVKGQDKGSETERNQAKHVFNKGPIPTYSNSYFSLLDY
jgi:hypothetical protein